MSCKDYVDAFARETSNTIERFLREYNDPCWLKPSQECRLIAIGAIYRTRIIDERQQRSVCNLYEEQRRTFVKAADEAVKTKELTRSQEVLLKGNVEERAVLTFLDSHDHPIQISRILKLNFNPLVHEYLMETHKECSRWIWTLFEFFSSKPGDGLALTQEEWAKFELTCFKRLIAVRKVPRTEEIVYLSIMDLLEEWCGKDDPNKYALLDNLRANFKLCDFASHTFRKAPAPSGEWKAKVRTWIKGMQEGEEEQLERRPSVSELRGSFSAVDMNSPLSGEGEKTVKIYLTKLDLKGQPISISPLEDLKKYVIGSTLVEMRGMSWILPEEIWEEMGLRLSQTDSPTRLFTILYLSVCHHKLFLPTNKMDLASRWNLIQETLHLLIDEKEDRKFLHFLETALLFSFSFHFLQERIWLGASEEEKQAKLQIFGWMRECNFEEQKQIFTRVLQYGIRRQETLSPLEALKFCQAVREKYAFSFYLALSLWLQIQNPPEIAKPKEKRWLTMEETRGFLDTLEKYCHHIPLTGEMVSSLFLHHPLHLNALGEMNALLDMQNTIIQSPTPFLSPFERAVLINNSGGGRMAKIDHLFLDGIAHHSDAYRIREKIAQRVRCATLGEKGYKPALLACPLLKTKNEEWQNSEPQILFEGWLNFNLLYGKALEGEPFSIGTWLKPDPKEPFIRFEVSLFQTLDFIRGRTFKRTLRINSASFALEEFRRLFEVFVETFLAEWVAQDQHVEYGCSIDYSNDQSLDQIFQETLKCFPIALEAYKVFSSGKVQTNDPRNLFRFLITLKLQTRNPNPPKQRQSLPTTSIEKALQVRQGDIEPLPDGFGATLMNAIPKANFGNLYNIDPDEHGVRIKAFANAVRLNKIDPVELKIEVNSGPSTVGVYEDLLTVLTYEKREGAGTILCAHGFIHLKSRQNPLMFQEKLHLPLSFPEDKLEKVIVILLCRVMRRYYELNG